MRGFSLVELSIVLVILGLLTGGILSGQSLIRAAEIRKVTTTLQTYQGTMYTFRDKYFALPGDMKTATKFWGAANTAGTGGECADRANNAGTGTETCNGNGNGDIPLNDADALVNERFRFWQHLANAGLIEGNYTGLGSSEVTGTNIPRLLNGGITAQTLGNFVGAATVFPSNYGTALRMVDVGLTATEAWNIDTKIDDGKATTGRFIAGYRNAVTCVTSPDPLLAEYAVQDNGLCRGTILKTGL